ncbi:hypothetical protein GA840_04095 [Pediococcus ethanolidurans]|uniref:hypothetical protein n=1 Tax=Pediococcus ethanolidurans TaxID=319653 RepID=UPI002955C296|nr:hypothetical protein [Pediococcus ethanolidurans]MDV7719029.1 hypothetical protein [Pediococcus ethanolidurans]
MLKLVLISIISSIISFLLKLKISDWLSTFAILISLYTLWKNRKHVSIDWSDNIEEAEIGSVFSANNGQINGTYEYAYIATLSVINPSPNDIGFFDLRAFNPKTNINLPLVTRRAFPMLQEDSKIYHILDEDNSNYAQLDIPERKFGILKANSFNRFDLIVVLPEDEKIDLDRINISFKISKYFFLKRDSFALTKRKKFTFSGKSYSVTGWKERRKSQVVTLRSQEESSENNSSKE